MGRVQRSCIGRDLPRQNAVMPLGSPRQSGTLCRCAVVPRQDSANSQIRGYRIWWCWCWCLCSSDPSSKEACRGSAHGPRPCLLPCCSLRELKHFTLSVNRLHQPFQRSLPDAGRISNIHDLTSTPLRIPEPPNWPAAPAFDASQRIPGLPLVSFGLPGIHCTRSDNFSSKTLCGSQRLYLLGIS